MKNFINYLKEAAGDTVGIMFGRFNPPHKGHKAAWEMASENDHWYVGTNQSTQGKKDPLPYDVKIKAMEALWPEVGSHIVPETNLFTLASKVFAEHGEGLNIVVYTDEDWLTKTLEKYNGEEGKHGYYNFASIQQKPTPRLSSATDVRNAVIADDREAFERAAGVPADYKIDGKDFFDLVAEYLLPHHTKESKSDKYIQQENIEESQMDINTLRKLAGMPEVEEGAPVNFKPAHGDSEATKLLVGVGHLLQREANNRPMGKGVPDSELGFQNKMSQIGGNMVAGKYKDISELVADVKSVGDEEQVKELKDLIVQLIQDYKDGDRAMGLKPDEKPEVDNEPSEFDAEEMESVNFDDIRAEYEGNEFSGALKKAKDAGEDEFEVDGKKYEVEEEEMDEGVKCDCCNATPCTCGPECPTCGGMDESIEETADNAVSAAMAELRKLAGL